MKCIAKVANMTNLGERTKRQAAEIMHNIAKKETLPEKILWDLQHLYSTYQVLRLERLSLNQIL